MDQYTQEIVDGLTAKNKYLSSKLFYDKKGLELFSEIMRLPEYYLVNSEVEILNSYSDKILSHFSESPSFNIIDLGAGNALKTQVLLNEVIHEHVMVKYQPIDIDEKSLIALSNELQKQFPKLNIEPKCGNYFEIINDLKQINTPKLVLFLGSSIGNYKTTDVNEFLTSLHQSLNRGDKLLIGFDLIKNPDMILNAYNDKKGITKEFNFNMLKRLNKEFDANFDLNHFIHYPIYDPINFVAQSFLVSTKYQKVSLKKLSLDIELHAWEPIHTESSQKYSTQMIEEFAVHNNFKIIDQYHDAKHYFVDSLWEVE